MAERRMFSKSIINSARFIRMPQSARLLYYDLGMAADDDGIVEAFVIMRTTGASDDDLNVLVDRGFVLILNDDLVSWIKDWNANNTIQKDRYHESQYKALLQSILDRQETEKASRDTGCIQAVSTLDTGCIHPVSIPETEDRIGELGEVNQDSNENKKPSISVFSVFAGEDTELQKALQDFEEMRKANGKPLTDRARELLTEKLKSDFKRGEWVPVLKQSVINSWAGIFPLARQNQSGHGKESTLDRLARLTSEGAFDEDLPAEDYTIEDASEHDTPAVNERGAEMVPDYKKIAQEQTAILIERYGGKAVI